MAASQKRITGSRLVASYKTYREADTARDDNERRLVALGRAETHEVFIAKRRVQGAIWYEIRVKQR